MCVHTRHCCSVHGCKYGEDDICPVALGLEEQEYPCEYCNEIEDLTFVEEIGVVEYFEEY